MKRPPRQKPKTVEIAWVRASRNRNADWWVVFGPGANSSDARFALAALLPLAEELVERGYDRESIRFTTKRSAP